MLGLDPFFLNLYSYGRYISKPRENIPQRVKEEKIIGYVTRHGEKKKPPVPHAQYALEVAIAGPK
jgi:hypothetical protein